MSILFVLLTFLLILTVMYFRRPQDAVNGLQVAPGKRIHSPVMLKKAGFEVPEGYCFHPGHTWVIDKAGRMRASASMRSPATCLARLTPSNCLT